MTCVFTGLEPGTRYGVDATVSTAYRSSASSMLVPVTTVEATAPGALAAVTAKNQLDGTIRVAWTPVTQTGGRPVSSVQATAYDQPANGSILGACAAAPTPASGSCIITGIPLGTRAYVDAAAVNSVGTGTGVTTRIPVLVATPPSAPQQVTATLRAANSIAVAWRDPASLGGLPVSLYEVSLLGAAGKALTTCTTTALTCVLTHATIAPGSRVVVSVRARNSVDFGNAASTTVALPAATAPAAPTLGTITRGATTATVSFAPGSDGGLPATYTVLAWSAASGGSQLATCLPGSSSACTLSVKSTVKAWFEVRAVNALGTTPSARIAK